MIYGSVCSGIEAATVAWHPLGWTPSFFSEIEPFPRAVLAHRWPGVPVHGDFTTIQPGDYAAIDLLVGGTPCQSFSVAGLRGGLDDDRGNLALEYLRLADRLRPRWLVWENVPGVLSSNGGRDFGAILGGMVELGYGFAYRVLDAQHFGVPQRRRRVFVVGHSGDWRPAAAVLFERHSLQGHPPPRREAGARIAGAITGGSGGGCGPDDNDAQAGHILAGTLAGGARQHGGFSYDDVPSVAHSLRADGFDASEDGTGRGTPLVAAYGISSDCFDRSGEAANGEAGDRAGLGIVPDASPALRAKRPNAVAYGGNNTAGPVAVATALSAHGGPHGRLDFESETFVTAFSAKDHGADAGPMAAHPPRRRPYTSSHANAGVMPAVQMGAAVRRLTPRECERLQGFPDDYTLIPWRKAEAADGPRYKALGNSMAVPVMGWIGRRIEAVSNLPVLERKEP